MAPPGSCAWNRIAIGKERIGNRGYIDSANLYLSMPTRYTDTRPLRIRGLFPYARYMSLAVYSVRSRLLIDRVMDQAIVPDPGSTNPFRPLVARDARRRSYTLFIQQGPAPAHGRAANTLYTGPDRPVLLLYRVYAPDQGADPYGNVPKPSVAILDGSPTAYRRAIPLAPCSSPQPIFPSSRIKLSAALRWRRVGALGIGPINADDAYLVARLNRDDADEYIVRFKAPTFAQTYGGQPITGREDTRFWSMCQYDMVSERVVACLHDYQAVQGADGMTTIVVSTLAHRPRTASRANGVNWLPFGPEQIGLLMYRQLLPRRSFQGSIANLAAAALPFEMQRALGPFFPAIQTCSQAGFTPTTCADQGAGPFFCSGLVQDEPCSASPGGARSTPFRAQQPPVGPVG